MAEITFAKAAETLGKRKSYIEAQMRKGDKWTKNALEPKMKLIESKLQELQVMNEQAKQQKAEQAYGRFMKKYGDSLPPMSEQMEMEQGMEQQIPMDNQQGFAMGGYLPKFYGGGSPRLEEIERYDFMDIGLPETLNRVQPLNNNYVTTSNVQQAINSVQPLGNSSNSYGLQQRVLPETTMNRRNEPLLDVKRQSRGFNIPQGTGNTLAQLAPIAWNAYNAIRPIKDIPRYNNAYEKESAGLIRNSMNYDINPQLEQARIQTATGNTVARDAAQGSGADYMRYVGSNLRGNQQYGNQLRGQKQNIESQMKQRGAGMLHDMGEASVARQINRDQQLAMAEANRRLFAGQAATDVSEYAQRQNQTKNLTERDRYLLELYNSGQFKSK